MSSNIKFLFTAFAAMFGWYPLAPKPGEWWEMAHYRKPDHPWAPLPGKYDHRVVVLDVRDGWVRYNTANPAHQFTPTQLGVFSFLNIYTKVKEIPQ